MNQVQVVHAIIRKDGKFLLGKRSISKQNAAGFWASIGGRLENGETLEACAIRECREEIGVEVKILTKLREVNEIEASHYWFEVEIVSGVPELANEEHSDLRWFSKLEVEKLSPIVAEDIEIIRTLDSRLS